MPRRHYFKIRHAVQSIDDAILSAIFAEFCTAQREKYHGVIKPVLSNLVFFYNSVESDYGRTQWYFLLKNHTFNERLKYVGHYKRAFSVDMFRALLLDCARYPSSFCTHLKKKWPQDIDFFMGFLELKDPKDIDACKAFVHELLSFASACLWCEEYRHPRPYPNKWDQIWDLWRYGDMA